MSWIEPSWNAICPHCKSLSSSQGHNPAGRPCRHCGTLLVRQNCPHTGARRALRASRFWPGIRREQCMICCTILHWLDD